MWLDKKVSVIFPTYNEKDSIRAAIGDFFASGVVDEVIVVNNNAAAGTSEEVARTRAVEVHEPRQGYGAAIRRGLHEATGDLLIVAEPDGTFLGRDVHKLLAYAQDFDIVYGSRTVNDFIWDGANMGPFLRWGNWAVAKMMEVLFNATSLTDVGCTVRLLKREAYQKLEPYFTVDGNFFGPEMMLLSIHAPLKIVQIPVNYLPRVGESSVTGSFWKAFRLGLRMIALILEHRFKRAVGWKPGDPPAEAGDVPPGVAALVQALLVLLFLLLAGSHLREPFVIDEMDFPALGRAIAHTGLPIYYRGEDLPAYEGIYHVPFYGYALGGWLRLFGDSVVAVRSFTLACSVVAWALGLRILGQACRALGARAQTPALVYSLLLLTSAYWIQSALLPDIDGTTLIVANLGLVTLLLDWLERPTWRRALLCSAALGVSLLSKLTTTLGFMVFLPVAAVFAARRGARTWAQAAAMVVGGVAIFLAAWGLLAHFAALDFWFPFRFTLQSAGKGTAGAGRLHGLLTNLKDNVREFNWLGPGLAAALVAGFVGTVVLAGRRRPARGPLLILAGSAAMVVGIYAVIIGPVFWFCKYYVVAMPLAAACVALTLGATRTVRLTGREYAILVAILVLGLGWMVAVERDSVLMPFAATTLGTGHRPTLAVIFALIGATLLVLWRAFREARIGAGAVVLIPLILTAIPQGLGTAWAQVGAPYSTRYYYGERGLDRVAEILRREVPPGEPILSAKDVGMLAQRPFYEDHWYYDSRARLDGLLDTAPPRLLVVRKKFDRSIDFYPGFREAMLHHGYRPWASVDDFVVWRQEGRTAQ